MNKKKLSLSEQRRVRNEQALKAHNRQNRQKLENVLSEDLPPDLQLSLVCECSDYECRQRLQLPLGELLEIRKKPGQFVISPGHVDPPIEDVVFDRTGYSVVSKPALAD